MGSEARLYTPGVREDCYGLLPEPWTNITIDFEAIIRAFQDVRYIGELRQRWNEIKKLQVVLPLPLLSLPLIVLMRLITFVF